MDARLRIGDNQGRNSPQFPNKFNTLPGIQMRGSPQPNYDNQLVPMTAGSRMDSLDAEERIRQLETRINVTEKSNRALLEEVVRLQSELKGTVRRNEEILREERQARHQMETSARAANDIVSQIGARLKRTEEKLQEERSAVSALVNHTKSVEQAVLGSQQELISRRDLQAAKLEELRNELDSTSRAKDQMERALYNVVDEMRQLKGRVESQYMDFNSVAVDLRNKSKKIEEDSRQQLDQMRKQNESHSQTEQTTSQLRAQIESRLSELRDVVVDLRNKQDSETQERRMLEQQLQVKINDLTSAISEQNRKREEAMHALDSIGREKEHAAETERVRLQAKISEIAEEVSKKILSKEIKLRDESQQRFSQIEKRVDEKMVLMHAEQQARMDHEKETRDTFEKRWESFKRLSDDEIQQIKELQKLDRRKTGETLTKLDESLSILEQEGEQNRKHNDKIITAEIKSRKLHEKATMDKINAVQEKLSMATTTLQQAVGGTVMQMQKQTEKLKADVKTMIEETLQGQGQEMKELQDQLKEMSEKITEVEEQFKAKMNNNTAASNKVLQAKLDSLTEWQATVKKTMKELQASVTQIPEDIYAVEEKFEVTKSDMSIKISEEKEEREREFENLKKEVSRLIMQAQAQQPVKQGKGAPATVTDMDNDAVKDLQMKQQRDVEQVHASIRKLAESIQTVKTVLGMKIQSESKARGADIQTLNSRMSELRMFLTLSGLQRTASPDPVEGWNPSYQPSPLAPAKISEPLVASNNNHSPEKDKLDGKSLLADEDVKEEEKSPAEKNKPRKKSPDFRETPVSYSDPQTTPNSKKNQREPGETTPTNGINQREAVLKATTPTVDKEDADAVGAKGEQHPSGDGNGEDDLPSDNNVDDDKKAQSDNVDEEKAPSDKTGNNKNKEAGEPESKDDKTNPGDDNDDEDHDSSTKKSKGSAAKDANQQQ